MNSGRAFILLGAVALALALGLATLFQLRLGRGDVFPPYSSLRADPLGTRALHDSLAQLPGFRVERRTTSLGSLAPMPPRLIVLAGLDEADWTHLKTADFEALDAAVRAGSRLVIAFHARIASDKDAAPQRTPADQPKPPAGDPKNPRTPKITYADLRQKWGITLQARKSTDRDPSTARRTGIAPASLPASVDWQSDLFFRPEPGTDWHAIYRRRTEGVLLDRTLGLGSIVLASDSFFLSNEALQRARRTDLLAWLIGPHTRVLFDESHLGVIADRGVATLVLRYGLAPAAGTLLLLAGLFVWRRMALFVPPGRESTEVALTYHPAAGLEALLRRAVPANDLVAACAAEWKRSARPDEVARVEAALAANPKILPAAGYNVITAALRRRRSGTAR